MRLCFQKPSVTALATLALLGLVPAAFAETKPTPKAAPPHFADYDSEPRRADGRVDVEALAKRLQELGVTTYYWLVWHAATDWDDLKLFLPLAAQKGLTVWAYLVPPTESPPLYGDQYSEPFRLDYNRWAEEIARLSLQHTNLTGWVIDDFYGNHEFFTPQYIGQMRERARRLNPRLQFLPLMYFYEMQRPVIEAYREVIDGMVVAYPPNREEIDRAWRLLNDAPTEAGELNFPWNTSSQAGDFISASQSARALPGARRSIRFRERDDFTAATSGYHFKQLLVDGVVVWEQDVAGGTNEWQEIAVQLPGLRPAGSKLDLAFRLLDKQGVSNFGIHWELAGLKAEGLDFASPLEQPEKWAVRQQGAFEAGFGPSLKKPSRQFKVPFIVMTAGQASEFRLRHGEPATPERIAEWLRICLQAWREGKCDGVATYCLDKEANSPTFDLARKVFGEYR
jgi:hypothetical protein